MDQSGAAAQSLEKEEECYTKKNLPALFIKQVKQFIIYATYTKDGQESEEDDVESTDSSKFEHGGEQCTTTSLQEDTESLTPDKTLKQMLIYMLDSLEEPLPEQTNEQLKDTVRMLYTIDLTTDDLPKTVRSEMMPYVEQMLRMFFSKAVLYKQLKEIVRLFPDWLSRNKISLSSTMNHYYVLERLCAELEKHSDTGVPDSTQLNKLLDLFQEFKEYGRFPRELFELAGKRFKYEEVATDADECYVM